MRTPDSLLSSWPPSPKSRARGLARLALLTVCIAGCAGNPERQDGAPPGSWENEAEARVAASHIGDPRRRQIVETAVNMIGVRYLYGGESPQGFDCSGLVQFSYRSAGINVPRTAREQLKASREIDLDAATAGDLLFFESPANSHVGIYLGGGRFVHAPASNRNVSIGSLDDPYYKSHFVRAGRLPALKS